jgi:hypothetical protein
MDREWLIIPQGATTAAARMVAAYADGVKNGPSTMAVRRRLKEDLSVRIARLLPCSALSLPPEC